MLVREDFEKQVFRRKKVTTMLGLGGGSKVPLSCFFVKVYGLRDKLTPAGCGVSAWPQAGGRFEKRCPQQIDSGGVRGFKASFKTPNFHGLIGCPGLVPSL